jgi:hypothetical protein
MEYPNIGDRKEVARLAREVGVEQYRSSYDDITLGGTIGE